MPFSLVLALTFALPGRSPLPFIRPAPEFTLMDQDGVKVRSDAFRGKIVLVSFIFTTCNGSCPATTHRLAVVQKKVAEHPRLKNAVQFVSISLDPVRDTPEVLRGYRRLYELEGCKNWTFLTGTPQEITQVLTQWDMWARPAADGQLDHPSRIFLVDTLGHIREIYNLSFMRTPWVLEDLETLLP